MAFRRSSRWLRWPVAVAVCTALALLGAACSGDGDDDVSPSPAAPGASTASAASPAAGATATPSISPAPPITPNGYRAVPVFPHIDRERMVALVPFPDDAGHAAVLTQYEGVIYRATLADDGEDPAVFLDLSDKLIDGPGNEEGLLGMAFAPDYAQSGRFYVYYSAGPPRRTVLERYIARDDVADPASGRRLLEIEDPFSNHNGGAVEFGPDGYLYLAIGDGGSSGDPQRNGQNTGALLAKILRLDVSGEAYTVPPSNPFANGGGRGEVWAYGLRNPWRFTFDRETGDLWVGDVGQGGWEEVDRVERGGNYGWSIMEGPDCFRDDSCDRSGLILPRAAYRTHQEETCAVTGGYVYRGTALPELAGWYVYGDFCSGRVWALDTRSDDSEPVVLADTGKSISSFAQDAAGELYLVTFNETIFRLERAD